MSVQQHGGIKNRTRATANNNNNHHHHSKGKIKMGKKFNKINETMNNKRRRVSQSVSQSMCVCARAECVYTPEHNSFLLLCKMKLELLESECASVCARASERASVLCFSRRVKWSYHIIVVCNGRHSGIDRHRGDDIRFELIEIPIPVNADRPTDRSAV